MQSERGRYFDYLYQIAKEVNSSHDAPAVMRSLTEGMAKAVRAKACSLMLLSPDRKTLWHSAAYGLSSWYVRKGPVSVDLSLAEALQGKAVAVLNAVEDPRVQYRQQARKEGIASILCVPVELKGEVIGVMRIYTSEPREFTGADVALLQAAANLGAIALENARLYESAKLDYRAIRADLLEWYAAWGPEALGEPVVSQEEVA